MLGPILHAMITPSRILAPLVAVGLVGSSLCLHAAAPTPVVLAVDGITAVRNLPVLLTERLGYFRDEGLQVTLQETAASKEIDAQLQTGAIAGMVAYYHHTIVAQMEEGLPTVGVVTMALSPGYKVLVATRAQAQVHSLADLKGRRIISGGPHSAKTTTANWLVLHAGFGLRDYTRLSTGDRKQIAEQLRNGTADLVVAPEPDASSYVTQGVAAPFLDLYGVESTRQAVGSDFPTTILFISARQLAERPALAQKLVNAFVRTLHYLKTHDAADVSRLVPELTTGRNQDPAALREGLRMFAGDGLMPEGAARAEARVVAAQFPQYAGVRVEDTYTNRFVEAALQSGK